LTGVLNLYADLNGIESRHRLALRSITGREGILWLIPRRLLWGSPFGSQSCILQFATKHVINSQLAQVIFQSKDLHDTRVGAESDGRVTLFYFGERPSGDSCALRDRLSRILSPETRQLEIGAKALK
jgi:hypothetical protein